MEGGWGPAGAAQPGDESRSLEQRNQHPKTLAQAALPAGLGSVPVPQAAAGSRRTFAGQHKGMEKKLLSAMPLVLKNPGCSSGCRSSGKDACSVQATATAGRREGDGVPGWQAVVGGQGGRRHDNGGGEVWRRMVGDFCEKMPAAPLALASPAVQHAQPRSTGPCAPVPAGHRHQQDGCCSLLPGMGGHPAAPLGPRVMGYLGVGLLSLPLQEPELLLLLSEEVP